MTTTTAKEQLHNWFQFHPPTPAQTEVYNELRDKCIALAEVITENCPESADTNQAILRLRETVMFANAAIATHQHRAAGSSR